MDNNKWLMFKNYMHNELGITKEDIREWVVESVNQQAKKALSEVNYYKMINDRIKDNIDSAIKGGWNKSFNDEIVQKVVKELSSKIRLTLQE